MLVLENKATQVDSLLDKMAEDIQLDKTRYERMIQSYEAVKKWIEADEAFFKPYKYEVYPHGSVRIFTSVKPIGKDEFDLDIVLHFVNSLILHSPLRIYTELKRRLSEHETYRKMLEPKSRCLRLNYSGDFHMDIMPGIQESLLDVNKINVPDRELGKWVSSNPRGFAEWFMGKANLAKSSLLERAVKVEKIQADDFNKKKPLQRAVQLIKRYRDIYFENDSRYKTRSIVLTTIAGEFYMGEESIFDTIDQIITRIRSKIYYPQRLKIYNPINPEEDFTDKWDTEPKYYEAFIDFVEHLYREWQKLKKESGVIEEGKIFKGLFGAELFERAQMQETNLIGSYRKTNDLGIIRDTGIISKSVNSNTEQIKKIHFLEMKISSSRKTIPQQLGAMRSKYPHFEVVIKGQRIIARGSLQPTARSEKYDFVLEYKLSGPPKIKIISPNLIKNSRGENIPHMYNQKYLCLYRPLYREFKNSDFLCNTIIPWASLWLYYYELWHLTGKWLGGGEHPKNSKSEKKR